VSTDVKAATSNDKRDRATEVDTPARQHTRKIASQITCRAGRGIRKLSRRSTFKVANTDSGTSLTTACVNNNNLDWMSEWAILAARNKDVDSLNFNIQSKIAGELRSYKSVDSTTDENEADNYPTEFLNSLDVPGTPPHN
ncbi:Uncharacterized protein FWK35_00036765, partial [Aphis craccivora]